MNATETIKPVTLHQQLINEAFAYKVANDLNYEPFVESLDKRHKAAILFKDLNYQVINGGFWQWSDNGFGKDIYVKLLIGYLEEIRTESAVILIDLLKEYQQIKTDIESLDPERIHNVFNELEGEYGNIEAQLLVDVNEWLSTVPAI